MFVKLKKQREKFVEFMDVCEIEETKRKVWFNKLEVPKIESKQLKSYPIIGNKYYLMNEIERTDANELYEKTKIKIEFKENELKKPFIFGQGQFGNIRLAQDIDSGKFVAVKTIKGNRKIDSEIEVGILNRLKGLKNVIQFYDTTDIEAEKGEKTRYQFMEIANGGNGNKLKNRLSKEENIDLKTKIMLHLIDSLAKGLKNCHKKKKIFIIWI